MSDLRCWMCDGFGAIRGIVVPFPLPQGKLWERFEGEGPLNLSRDEHACPACGGYGRPRRTFFPHQMPPLDPPREITLDDVIAEEQRYLDQLKAEQEQS